MSGGADDIIGIIRLDIPPGGYLALYALLPGSAGTAGANMLAIDVPAELNGYSILKLVLQPIVENAILHGILEKEEEKGSILIFGRLEGNTVYLCVQDDGVGITDKRINEILSGESTNESHGNGVHNINERLKLNYGNQYGLSFVSEVGKYTTATLSLPDAVLGAG